MKASYRARTAAGTASCIAALALALGCLAVPGIASAAAAKPAKASGAAPDAPPVPLSEQKLRGKPHPDCTNGVPLFEHTVQRGEHLGAIAGRYGIRGQDLVAVNPELKDPNLIRPGDTIRVCPEIAPRIRKQIEVVVDKGDTLSEIAQAHGLTVKEVLGFQSGKLTDPNRVRAGDKLMLWVDGGLVEAFRPAPPPKRKKTAGRSTNKVRHRRVSAQLPKNDHYYLKRPKLAFGTPKTIELIRGAVNRYKQRYARGPKVHVGDISKRGGGRLYPHLSHRSGRDVDLGYVLKGADAHRTRFSGVTATTLDVPRTWALVKSFLDTHQVVYVFMDYRIQKILYNYARSRGVSENTLDELFQYPRGRGRNHGIVRHWRSHKNHFHVRFKR